MSGTLLGKHLHCILMLYKKENVKKQLYNKEHDQPPFLLERFIRTLRVKLCMVPYVML